MSWSKRQLIQLFPPMVLQIIKQISIYKFSVLVIVAIGIHEVLTIHVNSAAAFNNRSPLLHEKPFEFSLNSDSGPRSDPYWNTL